MVILSRRIIVVVVGVQVLVDSSSAPFFGGPERDRKPSILSIVEMRDSDVVAIAIEADTIDAHGRLAVECHLTVVGGCVCGIAQERHINRRSTRGLACGQRHWKILFAHCESALNLRTRQRAVGYLQPRQVTHEVPVGVQVSTAADDDILVKMVVRHGCVEVERVRIRNVSSNHPSGVEAQLRVGHQAAIIESPHTPGLADQDDLQPGVCDVVEVASIMQREIEVRPVLGTVDQVEADHCST